MGYSCCDGGRALSRTVNNITRYFTGAGDARIVGVESLELGEIAVERGHVSFTDAPEGADFEDFA
jgi:hypothetical protein